MNALTTPLVLAPDAAVDFQLHTTFSDGEWTPEQLIDYLVGEQFGMAAITDHDRLDTIAVVGQMAAKKGLPLLAAVEISAEWEGQSTDVLCFGVDPNNEALLKVVQTIGGLQRENTLEVCENLSRKGITFLDETELKAVLNAPSSSHPMKLGSLLKRHGYSTKDNPAEKILSEAGCVYAAIDIAPVVDAVHQAGGVCLIAHPGRGGNNLIYDAILLDKLREDVTIDGFEAHYPAHSPEQTSMFREYAQKYGLLTSSGSDSHGPDKPPIKYRADLSRGLLERCGIEVR